MSLLDKDTKPTSEAVPAQVNAMEKLLDFIYKLQQKKYAYRLDCVRDAIMVEVYIPGEHWEVEFFADGNVEVEVFRSEGDVKGYEEADQSIVDLLEFYQD